MRCFDILVFVAMFWYSQIERCLSALETNSDGSFITLSLTFVPSTTSLAPP